MYSASVAEPSNTNHIVQNSLFYWSGALAGAGGATAYMNGFDFSAMARSLLMGPPHQSLPWQAQMNNKGEMDALYKLVRSKIMLYPHRGGTRWPWTLVPGVLLCSD